MEIFIENPYTVIGSVTLLVAGLLSIIFRLKIIQLKNRSSFDLIVNYILKNVAIFSIIVLALGLFLRAA